MKFLLLLIATKTVCSAKVNKIVLLEDTSKRFFHFAGDGDGVVRLVDQLEPVDYNYVNEYTIDPNSFEYRLFTRSNPLTYQELFYGDTSSVINSNFKTHKVTVFISHGWYSTAEASVNKILTEAFLVNDDVNVIVFDWRKLSRRNYLTSRYAVGSVGRCLGQFAIWLTTLGLCYDRIHLVGFSLGAHVVGNAGKEAKGRFHRITALDPAGPLFNMTDVDRVMASDARYVEVIHSNNAFYGFRGVCGDADFYANGGQKQPDCWTNYCSHYMAFMYMASTIKCNHLIGTGCKSIQEAEAHRCNGPKVRMGNSDIKKSARGIFFVRTNITCPY